MNPCCGNKQKSEVERLVKIIDGNSRPGLVETTARLSIIINELQANISSMTADLKVLVMFQAQVETSKEALKVKSNDTKWMITTVIALVVAILSITRTLVATI